MSYEKTLAKAIAFATKAHAGQKRKYTGEDYVVHPIAVGRALYDKGEAESVVIAGILHDTIEDTVVTYADVVAAFGEKVADYVWEVTDKYTTGRYAEYNRATRKTAEADRLGGASAGAKAIKIEDIADNTKSIVAHDAKFAAVYLKEIAYLLEKIT